MIEEELDRLEQTETPTPEDVKRLVAEVRRLRNLCRKLQDSYLELFNSRNQPPFLP